MKNRFAMLAVLGAILCSIFIAGCGGSSDDSGNASTNNATNNAANAAAGDGS